MSKDKALKIWKLVDFKRFMKGGIIRSVYFDAKTFETHA